MSIKGFFNSLKDSLNEYVTLQPLGSNKYGIDSVMNAMGVIANDVVDSSLIDTSSANRTIITATAHSAQVGDQVKITSGAAYLKAGAVLEVTTDTITVGLPMPGLAPADTFQILRGVNLQVNPATGGLEVTSAPLAIVDFIDNQDNGDAILVPLLDASNTNIPARGATPPVEIVASLAARARKIQVFQDFGFRCGLYAGAASAETLIAVLPLTPDFTVEVDIPAGTRLSLKSLEDSLINVGSIAINFLG